MSRPCWRGSGSAAWPMDDPEVLASVLADAGLDAAAILSRAQTDRGEGRSGRQHRGRRRARRLRHPHLLRRRRDVLRQGTAGPGRGDGGLIDRLWLIGFKIQYLVGNKPRIARCHRFGPDSFRPCSAARGRAVNPPIAKETAMDAATLFDLANAGALIGWLLLAFAPLKRALAGARCPRRRCPAGRPYSGLLIGAGHRAAGWRATSPRWRASPRCSPGPRACWSAGSTIWRSTCGSGPGRSRMRQRRGLKHALRPALPRLHLPGGTAGPAALSGGRAGLARDKTFA